MSQDLPDQSQSPSDSQPQSGRVGWEQEPLPPASGPSWQDRSQPQGAAGGWEAPDRRRCRRGNWGTGGTWIGGAILILLGVVFLLQNLGLPVLQNWWALFILIPAVGSLATAWNIYQNNDGHMTAAVRGPLMGGLVLALIAFAFLFNLNWGMLWPVILIVLGLAALLNALMA